MVQIFASFWQLAMNHDVTFNTYMMPMGKFINDFTVQCVEKFPQIIFHLLNEFHLMIFINKNVEYRKRC